MKRAIPFVTTVCFSLLALLLVAASAQDKQAPSKQGAKPPAEPGSQAADQSTGKVEVLSTALVEEMPAVQGGVWTTDPSANKALVMRTRVARGFGYSTSDFALSYKSRTRQQKGNCVGVTARIPNGWVVNDKGVVWSFYPGGEGTLDGLGLLFLIPNDVQEVTLLYKDQPVGKALPIKRE